MFAFVALFISLMNFGSVPSAHAISGDAYCANQANPNLSGYQVGILSCSNNQAYAWCTCPVPPAGGNCTIVAPAVCYPNSTNDGSAGGYGTGAGYCKLGPNGGSGGTWYPTTLPAAVPYGGNFFVLNSNTQLGPNQGVCIAKPKAVCSALGTTTPNCESPTGPAAANQTCTCMMSSNCTDTNKPCWNGMGAPSPTPTATPVSTASPCTKILPSPNGTMTCAYTANNPNPPCVNKTIVVTSGNCPLASTLNVSSGGCYSSYTFNMCFTGCDAGYVYNSITNTCTAPVTSTPVPTPTSAPGCAAGQTGVYPVCCTSPQVYNSVTNVCGSSTPPAPTPCPSGQTGVAPVCCSSPLGYNSMTNVCESITPPGPTPCPSGQTGVAPVCCTSPQTYNSVSNTCVTAPPCPAGSQVDGSVTPSSCKCDVKGQNFSLSTNTCSCPNDYDAVVTNDPTPGAMECRPIPGREYYRTGSTTPKFFPVCGTNRIPVNASQQIPVSASSFLPNSTAYAMSSTGYQYDYATAGPVYVHKNYLHCACAKTKGMTQITDAALNAAYTSGKRTIYSDYLDDVDGQDSNESKRYSPVAIAKNENDDGRLGSLYSNSGSGGSACGCPNINEVAVDPIDATFVGSLCRSAVVSSPYRVLMTYNPAIHDNGARTQVMNRASEQLDSSGKVVGKIKLGRANGTTGTFTRKIWGCMDPFSLNTSSGECYFDPSKNACNEGNGSDVSASIVSDTIRGPSERDKFLNTINKKLACCLNQFGTSGQAVKFDCVENPISGYADFNTLWRSADTTAQGGQMNALVLTNVQGKAVSGFYAINGSRCEEFSEFGADIQPGIVNPADGVTAQRKIVAGGLTGFEAKGAVIQRPALASALSSWAKPIPTTAAQKRRCPVLVRAAMVAACPPNDPVPTVPIRTYLGPPKQCSAAENVKVHVRVEQVYEIAGQAKLKTIDSVVDANRMQAGDISIDRIIANKYGSACPPGQTNDGTGSCHY